MYQRKPSIRGRIGSALVLCGAWVAAGTAAAQPADSAEFATPNIIRKISRQSERLEMTSNTSRILTLDMSIPRVQVNNPELVAVTPMSANEIQVSAKKPGVTQINLWDTNKQVHTIDVIIYGDVKELEYALKTQFPNSSIHVRKYSQSLMLTGFVDSPDHVSPIMRLAEDYAPKVINNLEVGGVQQVLLKTKIFEVSRTKLRRLGVDWAYLNTGGDFVINSVSGLIETVGAPGSVGSLGAETFSFGIVDGGDSFFAFLDALEQNNVAKILAEPNLVSVSGRPAQFLEGGEIPILVPQSLGTSSIEYKPFGTQVDFLPIVLGNGNIRLEVRPRISDLDNSIGVILQDQSIPGFRVRQADTAVEMRAGQTFALAGLIQQRTESIHRGLPFVSNIPIVGVPFRRVEEVVNEIELLIMVTPEFVDAMDPHEVPPCGPGMGTMSPDNCALYWGGHIEVPNAYGPCGNEGCETCPELGHHGGYGHGGYGVPIPAGGYPVGPGVETGREVIPPGQRVAPPADSESSQLDPGRIHGELQLPASTSAAPLGDPAGSSNVGPRPTADGGYPQAGASTPVTRSYAPRVANYRRAASSSAPPAVPVPSGTDYSGQGGLIGPVGYDVK